MKPFNYDSPFMSFLTKCADLMILNLLWLLCCLPVVTIGASTTALYYCLLNQDKEGAPSVTRMFFSAFKSNFKKATLLWVVEAVVTEVAAINCWYFLGLVGDLPLLLRVLCLIPAAWLLMGASYLFPLQAQFENTVGRTLKNAMMISAAHLPTSLVVTVLNLVPGLIFYFSVELFLRTSVIWALIGISAIAYLNTFLLKKVFRQYMPEEDQAAEPEQTAVLPSDSGEPR